LNYTERNRYGDYGDMELDSDSVPNSVSYSSSSSFHRKSVSSSSSREVVIRKDFPETFLFDSFEFGKK